ncbi:MAG: hypothetical protein GVY20_10255 [Bacteroidetes bacterium]|jgi:hypothetical protein|nr:hypothetical protein [Bacteroidota bacterium]
MNTSIQRISSNWTLGLKIFFPTFWFIFYGAIVIAIYTATDTQLQVFDESGFKLGVLIFYISGSVIIYFTLISLKRVEFDEHFLYVSNFFSTRRIPWHNVKAFRQRSFFLFQTGSFSFNEPIQFGKEITFIQSRTLIKEFLKQSEELIAKNN